MLLLEGWNTLILQQTKPCLEEEIAGDGMTESDGRWEMGLYRDWEVGVGGLVNIANGFERESMGVLKF